MSPSATRGFRVPRPKAPLGAAEAHRFRRPCRGSREFPPYSTGSASVAATAPPRRSTRGYNLLAPPGQTCQVTVHGPAGDWSIFRPKDSFYEKNESRKHGPVPLPAEGDSPIFAAKDGSPTTKTFSATKTGTVPRERLPCQGFPFLSLEPVPFVRPQLVYNNQGVALSWANAVPSGQYARGRLCSPAFICTWSFLAGG